MNDPKIHTTYRHLGRLINVKFEGEQFAGHEILDTKVTINDNVICWITWKDIDDFTKKLNATVSKYEI